MDAKILGQLIRLARVEQNITQAQLAELIQVKQKSISLYEKGASSPALDTLRKLATALKKPVGYFMEDKPTKTIAQDLAYQNYLIDLESQLRKNDLFFHFENLIGKQYLLIEDNGLLFCEGNKGQFAKDVFFKTLEESSAFLGCLRMGAFYPSFHHLRALIELFAYLNYCLADPSKENERLKKYECYRELEIYRRIQDQKNGIRVWGLSSEFMERYSTLNKEVLEVFDVKLNELDKIKSWLGNTRISDLLDNLKNPNYKNTYENLSHYTHLSSFKNRSDFPIIGLPKYWEEILINAAKYCLDTCFYLIEKKCINEQSIPILTNIWTDIAPILLPKTKTLLEKSQKNR